MLHRPRHRQLAEAVDEPRRESAPRCLSKVRWLVDFLHPKCLEVHASHVRRECRSIQQRPRKRVELWIAVLAVAAISEGNRAVQDRFGDAVNGLAEERRVDQGLELHIRLAIWLEVEVVRAEVLEDAEEQLYREAW